MTTAWPATEATCRQLGITFDDWQQDLNRAILGKTADGLYAADTVGMSVPRQVGKTFDVGGLCFADSIINPGTTTVWTAHRFKVARESFNEMRAWAISSHLAPHIDSDAITTAAGNECIPFRNGSRIVFAARERGAIRGFTKVRRLVLDEGQILTELALADLVPTMNQAWNPQIIIMGTPPKPADPSEVFTRIRTEAIAGDSDGVLWVELAADEGADPNDRAAWAKANPSYPRRTGARAILRMKKLLSVEDFAREALGIWDSDANNGGGINIARWRALATDRTGAPEIEAFGIDATFDLSSAVITAAGVGRDDGRVWLESVDEDDPQPGISWLLPRCVEVAERNGSSLFAVQKDGALAVLIPDMRAAGLTVVELDGADVREACAGIVKAVNEDGTIAHMGQPRIEAAIKGSKVLQSENGSFLFARRKSSGDLSPLYAHTFALFAATRASDMAPINNVW